MKKICSSCGQEKILENDFYKDSYSITGYRSYCKLCSKERCKKSYKNNKTKIDDKHNEWVANNREKWQDYYRNYNNRPKIKKLI